MDARPDNENEISIPPGLSRQGMVRHSLQGTGHRLSLDGIRFSPKASTSLRVAMSGGNATARIGRLRRAIDVSLRVSEGGTLEIGANTSFRGKVAIHASEGCRISIGEDCMFSSNILVRTTDSHAIYDLDSDERINPDADIVIGRHVWIGEGAKILKGARIGDGSVIGAGSVVSGEIPANCVVAGAPPRVLRENIRWER